MPKFRKSPRNQRPRTELSTLADQYRLLVDLVRWTPIAIAAGLLGGSASALLLWSLDVATRTREAHPWIILFLAPVGCLVGLMYKHFGQRVEAGNNLVLEEVHDLRQTIPLRMTPLILIGTFLTHLFGGSAGREGTAIQTGASLADQLTRPLRLSRAGRRILIMAGISAGFASVFGTPLSGAVFGLEVLAIGSVTYEAIGPCFLAAFIGDYTTKAWHIHHTIYSAGVIPHLSPSRLFATMTAGACFGLTAMLFARTTHHFAAFMKRTIPRPELRPVAGGLAVTAIVLATHAQRYIGLGIPTIQAAFTQPLPWYAFVSKSFLTTITLGSGFKGGEVTPLFFIGATLGNALSHVLPLPVGLLAAMGFVAVFAGAANTPIASTLMAIELFGAEVGAFAAIACVGSYLLSGQTGIYQAQHRNRSKRLDSERYTRLMPAALRAKAEPEQPGETPRL